MQGERPRALPTHRRPTSVRAPVSLPEGSQTVERAVLEGGVDKLKRVAARQQQAAQLQSRAADAAALDEGGRHRDGAALPDPKRKPRKHSNPSRPRGPKQGSK